MFIIQALVSTTFIFSQPTKLVKRKRRPLPNSRRILHSEVRIKLQRFAARPVKNFAQERSFIAVFSLPFSGELEQPGRMCQLQRLDKRGKIRWHVGNRIKRQCQISVFDRMTSTDKGIHVLPWKTFSPIVLGGYSAINI